MASFQIWWRRQVEVYQTPQTGFAICMGTLVGAAFAAPLFGWSLPDGPSNVIGAAIGAAAAVFGAEHMQTRREQSGRRELARVTQSILEGTRQEIELIRGANPANMGVTWNELRSYGEAQLARIAPLGMSQANIDPTAVLLCSEFELAWKKITNYNVAVSNSSAAIEIASRLPKVLQALHDFEAYNCSLT